MQAWRARDVVGGSVSELTECEAERVVIDTAIWWANGGSFERDPGPLQSAVADLLATREPHWVTGRTWADVRAGDTVRLPGAEPVHVLTVDAPGGTGWHVHPRTAIDTRRPQVALKHSLVGVRLAEYPDAKIMRMQPAGEVEILMTAAELAVTEMIGWGNRAYVTDAS